MLVFFKCARVYWCVLDRVCLMRVSNQQEALIRVTRRDERIITIVCGANKKRMSKWQLKTFWSVRLFFCFLDTRKWKCERNSSMCLSRALDVASCSTASRSTGGHLERENRRFAQSIIRSIYKHSALLARTLYWIYSRACALEALIELTPNILALRWPFDLS